METIIEAIVEVILLTLMVYPGAFIRWLFMGFKKPFKEVVREKVYWNGVLGLLVFVGLILIVRNAFF